ncbi:hypothetical protein [Mycoplasmopsis felifaucium]|uniref:Uncharacterized protein n=1 Tax=Mycoplasmopsis felifaucium TaxID=35768 RepID=A0ABZ2RS76_9BACT
MKNVQNLARANIILLIIQLILLALFALLNITTVKAQFFIAFEASLYSSFEGIWLIRIFSWMIIVISLPILIIQVIITIRVENNTNIYWTSLIGIFLTLAGLIANILIITKTNPVSETINTNN